MRPYVHHTQNTEWWRTFGLFPLFVCYIYYFKLLKNKKRCVRVRASSCVSNMCNMCARNYKHLFILIDSVLTHSLLLLFLFFFLVLLLWHFNYNSRSHRLLTDLHLYALNGSKQQIDTLF